MARDNHNAALHIVDPKGRVSIPRAEFDKYAEMVANKATIANDSFKRDAYYKTYSSKSKVVK